MQNEWYIERRNSREGFTLIELLLAITIFVLVIGTMYASLDAGVRALTEGTASMEIYQNARAGLNTLCRDLRKSLSPASLPYEEKDEEELLPGDELFLPERDQKEELQVTFRGTASEVQFVIRQEMGSNQFPSFDIREVRYRLGDNQTLIKELYRSLLLARNEDMIYRRFEEKFQQMNLPPPDFSGGMFEQPAISVVCDGVKGLELSYFDGQEWFEDWDSKKKVLNDYALDVDEELLTEEDEEEIGLPQLVKIVMTLRNGVKMQTATDIPGSDLNVVGYRSMESDFGGAFIKSQGRLDRLRQRADERGMGHLSRRRNRFM